jgi:RNA polymerase sigma-70 factor (ECF subfamily)
MHVAGPARDLQVVRAPLAASPVVGRARRGTSETVPPRAEADAAMERYASGDDASFDLLQQTMLHIHRARSTFIPGADVTPWAFAIARRLLIDSLRRGSREVLSEDGEVDPGMDQGPMADEVAQARELALRVERVLAKLPASQRAAFELIKNEGLSVAEAAQVLGTTVAAVKLRAHRAYQALRSALGDVLGGMEGRRS